MSITSSIQFNTTKTLSGLALMFALAIALQDGLPLGEPLPIVAAFLTAVILLWLLSWLLLLVLAFFGLLLWQLLTMPFKALMGKEYA